MNNNIKYKLDNLGIFAFIIGVVVIVVSSILFSNTWSELTEIVFYDVVVTVCATLFGAFSGLLTGFLSVVLTHIVIGNGIPFGYAISLGVLGCLIGNISDKYEIREGGFSERRLLLWLIMNAISNITALIFVRPFLDHIIYRKDMFSLLILGGKAALICSIPAGGLLVFLFYIITNIYRKKTRKIS